MNLFAGVLTWLGGVDAGGADHLGRGRANRDLNGALLRGWELLRGGLLVLLRDWLVVLWRRGLWSLMHGRRLTVLAGGGRKMVRYCLKAAALRFLYNLLIIMTIKDTQRLHCSQIFSCLICETLYATWLLVLQVSPLPWMDY